jgi:hypothetical protein
VLTNTALQRGSEGVEATLRHGVVYDDARVQAPQVAEGISEESVAARVLSSGARPW